MTIRRGQAGTARFAPASALLGAGLMVEIVAGVAAVIRPPAGGAVVLVVAAAIAIGSMTIVARSTMPQRTRMVVIVVLCALLLAVSAAQDPFGIRTVRRDLVVADGQDPAAAVARAADDRPASHAVTLRATGTDAEAQAAAVELARQANTVVDAPDAEIDGTLTLAAGGGATTYELNWSLVRADLRLWCGRMTVAAPTRAIALTQIESRLADALARSRGGALRCS